MTECNFVVLGEEEEGRMEGRREGGRRGREGKGEGRRTTAQQVEGRGREYRGRKQSRQRESRQQAPANVQLEQRRGLSLKSKMARADTSSTSSGRRL